MDLDSIISIILLNVNTYNIFINEIYLKLYPEEMMLIDV